MKGGTALPVVSGVRSHSLIGIFATRREWRDAGSGVRRNTAVYRYTCIPVVTNQKRPRELALGYADTIHGNGSNLLAVFRDGMRPVRQVLHIGAVATLSRNFQEKFVEPLLDRGELTLMLQSASLTELLTRLAAHNLDVVLSNRRMYAVVLQPWQCRRIAHQPVSLVGQPRDADKPFHFPEDMQGLNLILPSSEREVRVGFDHLCEKHQMQLTAMAEVDDMAMVRVRARASAAPAVV